MRSAGEIVMPAHRTWIATTVAFAMLASSAAAQGYPDRPIEMIVPSTPGSSADILGRVLTEEMAGVLGQRFVIYNKPGAGGVLGTAEAAPAKPRRSRSP
jgi:tripartite-type tricarboxylate transporter receptor subunit TctC